MPRIPVRTTPYHTLPRCTRHYKSKRDLILRALGKASFINGSQFVIAWISPKGEVDVYASELLQSAVSVKEGGVLGRKELEREAMRVRGEMGRRWEEIRRLEEKGEAPTMEDDAAEETAEVEDADEEDMDDSGDADRTLVEDASSSDIPLTTKHIDSLLNVKKPSPTTMMSSFQTAPRSSTPQDPPMHALTLAPEAIENYYTSRFSALQQATCKLVVKAWIKVIEPKKQMKYPYNKGEELKPAWWPEGVRHREPDHLSKTERLTLLMSIVRSPLITVSRLELSTAEAAAFISRPRLAILREVYLVAKEEERRRLTNDTSSELIVHLPNLPVSPGSGSPEAPTGVEKRSLAQYDPSLADKENYHGDGAAYVPTQQKRSKHAHQPRQPLGQSAGYNGAEQPYGQPFTFAPQTHWRDSNSLSAPPPHLSPYPHAGSDGGWASDYSRSPVPESAQEASAAGSASGNPNGRYHPNHLAPILNPLHHHHHQQHHPHSQLHSPVDSPAFPHSATMPPSAGGSYYSASGAGNNGQNGQGGQRGYMQQQQMEYLHAHGQQGHPSPYDYGSPYLSDQPWEGSFVQPA